MNQSILTVESDAFLELKPSQVPPGAVLLHLRCAVKVSNLLPSVDEVAFVATPVVSPRQRSTECMHL